MSVRGVPSIRVVGASHVTTAVPMAGPDDVGVSGMPQAETARAATNAATAKILVPVFGFLCIFVSPWVGRVAFSAGVELAIMMPKALHRVF